MSSPVALDASPLSLLCHPDTRQPVVQEINLWLEARLLAGTVVYDGAMKGLGQMIIVDHGRGLHSVYAHLGELKTRIDERLQKGQILGYTGNSDFYFELRQNGKPKSLGK